MNEIGTLTEEYAWHIVMIPFECMSARETARAVGGKWDALKKAWRIPAHEVERIQMLLEKEQGKA